MGSGNVVPSLTAAEHIGTNTGDNIEAKRAANYIWDTNSSTWIRQTAASAGGGTVNNDGTFAKETGGNLDSIKLDVDKIPSQGQALAAASMPVVLPAAQIITLTPPAAITNYAAETGGNLATVKTNTDKLDVALSTRLKPADTLTAVTTVGTITNVVHVDDNAGSLTVDATSLPLPTGAATGVKQDTGNASAASIDAKLSGTIATDDVALSTIISFLTTVTTAGTRVQLASHTFEAGILQAPSTNSGLIYVGGSTVSSSDYGAELQPGQSTGVAIDNTSKIYIDSSVNGDKCAVLGSA